tara:strand:+ start:307 stop:1134 length:828 start_codon:yes stop_codon:yes gene_type:complete
MSEIYRSNPLVIFHAVRLFLKDLSGNHSTVFRLYERDHINRHKGTAFGKVWVIFNPCIPLIVYNSLQWMGVFGTSSSDVPRVVSLTLGLTIYYTFSEALQSVSGSVVQNQGFIINTGISKMALILSRLYGVVTNFFIRMLAFVVTLLLYADYFTPKIFLLPLAIIPVLVLALSLGLVLSLLTVIYRDVLPVLSLVTFYLLFCSGVFGRFTETGSFFDVLELSPIYITINGFRDFLFLGAMQFTTGEWFSLTTCLVLFPISLLLFYRGESYVNSYF